MDIKVYHKETVPQPQGDVDVLLPDVIDIFPVFNSDEESLSNCSTIEDKEEALQAVAMATIFQRGLDPVDRNDGVQWGESLLGEVSVPQLITQLQEAVEKVSSTSSIEFSTINVEGKDYLVYKVRAV